MTTTAETSITYQDETLLYLLAQARSRSKEATDEAQRLEYEAIRRIQERGAKSLFSVDFEAVLEYRVEYDQPGLRALLEVLPAEGIMESFSPQHEETRTVPDKWDVTKAKKWAAKIGTEALAILEKAKIEGNPRVKLMARKQD